MAGGGPSGLGSAGGARGVGASRGPVRNYQGRPQFVDCVQMVHLRRDFQKCVDRGGAAEPVGQAGLKGVTALCATWADFGAGRLDHAGRQRRWEPVAQELHEALECGRGCAAAKAATFGANLLALEPAWWRFAAVEGVEPTNNHAERLLRAGVRWRKNAFGFHSEAGCRFVERLLRVVQTLRRQQRPVLD